MRLLAVLTEVFHSDGGIPTFNRALLRALCDFCEEYGAEATVLVLNDHPADLDSRYLSGPRVQFRGFRGNKPAFVVAYLREMLRGSELVLIGHANLLPMALPLVFLSRPFWLIAHGDEVWMRLPLLSRRCLARAATVLAVSDYTRRRLAAENGLAPERWHVFPNTLDPFFCPTAACPPGRPTLLSVTRLEAAERAAKGLADVLAVVPELRRDIPLLEYVIVGEGDDRAGLEQHSHSLGLQGCVRFAGHLRREELVHAYASCDVFVLPSNQEGFGIVFLEAMSHAKPAVAARDGGAPEVVVDGETGFLVKHGDQQALKSALAQLLSHPELRREMGMAGYRRFRENFTFEQFRARLIRLVVEELPVASYLGRWRRFQAESSGAPIRPD